MILVQFNSAPLLLFPRVLRCKGAAAPAQAGVKAENACAMRCVRNLLPCYAVRCARLRNHTIRRSCKMEPLNLYSCSAMMKVPKPCTFVIMFPHILFEILTRSPHQYHPRKINGMYHMYQKVKSNNKTNLCRGRYSNCTKILSQS